MVWIGEAISVLTVTLCSTITVGVFWLKSTTIRAHIDQYSSVMDGVANCKSTIAKAVFALLPSLLLSVEFSVWYIEVTEGNLPIWIMVLFSVSLVWHYCVLASPVIYYLTLGSVIHQRLITNNVALSQAVLGNGNEATEVKIQRGYFYLRRLYNELEAILSVPLFCFVVNAVYTLFNTVFYIFFTIKIGDKRAYIPTHIMGGLLTIKIMMLMGRTADTIAEKVSGHDRATLMFLGPYAAAAHPPSRQYHTYTCITSHCISISLSIYHTSSSFPRHSHTLLISIHSKCVLFDHSYRIHCHTTLSSHSLITPSSSSDQSTCTPNVLHYHCTLS